jgi:cytochrome c oxidase subunit 2
LDFRISSYGVAVSMIVLAGCEGAQSALAPAGVGAERIAALFWGTFVGALVIWAALVLLSIHAIWSKRAPHSEKYAKRLIVGGGVVFPALTLTGLLLTALSMLPDLVAPPPSGSLKIAVTGHQWWWRVRYLSATEAPIELANEIRLPVGEPVELELESSDVIHSFWVPSLGGKVDMIPGRKTRLVLQPTRTGTFRGVCAEYCGASHALMAFDVIVLEKADFERWLEAQQRAAHASKEPLATRGRELFRANGCSSCHAVRGTSADGVIGPDLTHAGSRKSIGASTLPNERASLAQLIANIETIKPGVHMPSFDMLPDDQLHAIAAYLESLQ